MSEGKDIHEDLKPGYSDYAHAGVKAGLSLFPIIGGPISEFFSMIIAPPLSKRREEWMGIIYQELVRLETEIDGFRIDNLKDNEQFISVLFYATNIAMRTHQKEKIEALRNAVINSATDLPLEDDIQFIFLNLIDRYTPLHLKLLEKMDEFHSRDVHKLLVHSSGSLIKSDLSILIPEFKNNFELSYKIEKDLVNDGLIYEDKFPDEAINPKTNQRRRTTILGQKFLKFIKSPFNPDQ